MAVDVVAIRHGEPHDFDACGRLFVVRDHGARNLLARVKFHVLKKGPLTELLVAVDHAEPVTILSRDIGGRELRPR